MKNKKKVFSIAAISLILIIGGLLTYNILFSGSLIELKPKEVIEKINDKESFVLCLSRTDCSHCQTYKPKLKKISRDYDIKLFFIDVDKYTVEEINEMKKLVTFDGSTPVTAFIVDGEEITASNRIFGDSSYEKIVKKLKNNGFIK